MMDGPLEPFDIDMWAALSGCETCMPLGFPVTICFRLTVDACRYEILRKQEIGIDWIDVWRMVQ